MADYYYPPSGFNFGGDDSTPPIVDDPALENFNVPERVDAFVAVALAEAAYTQGDIMWTMVRGLGFGCATSAKWCSRRFVRCGAVAPVVC